MSGRFAARKKIEVVKAPAKERTAFPQFEKVKIDVPLEEEEICNLVTRLIELGHQCYMAFILLSKDDSRKKKVAATQYTADNLDTIRELVRDHKYYDILGGFLYRNLIKAAAQIASNIVFSNDGGKAFTSMEGFGRLDKSHWVVDKIKTGRTVVEISSAQAVDLQIFCASVSLGKTQTIIPINNVMQTISTPSIIAKNKVENVRLEYAIKNMFSGLLHLPEILDDKGKPLPITDERIKSAPWIWKVAFTASQGKPIPVTGLPLPLIYFTYICASFNYAPFPISLRDLLYLNYDYIMKELIDQVAKFSVYRGGYFLNKYHYFNEGLKIAACRRVGGGLPVKWCSFNTVPNVVWEREGAYMEGGEIGTTVVPTRASEEFDGLFYDPVQCANRIHGAKGVIIPYDRNASGILALEEWILGRSRKLRVNAKDMKFQIYATYGPAPLLWVVHITDEDKADYRARYSRPAVEVLWKAMGTMPLYNFCASLNQLAARDCAYADNQPDSWPLILKEWGNDEIPTHPVLLSSFNPAMEVTYPMEKRGKVFHEPVPGFIHTWLNHEDLPGRHRIDSNRKKLVSKIEGALDGYTAFAQHHANDQREAPSEPNKRRKTEEPSYTAAENPFDVPTSPAEATGSSEHAATDSFFGFPKPGVATIPPEHHPDYPVVEDDMSDQEEEEEDEEFLDDDDE